MSKPAVYPVQSATECILGFRVTLQGGLRGVPERMASRYLQGGLQGGYLKGGFQVLSAGLKEGYLKEGLQGTFKELTGGATLRGGLKGGLKVTLRGGLRGVFPVFTLLGNPLHMDLRNAYL